MAFGKPSDSYGRIEETLQSHLNLFVMRNGKRENHSRPENPVTKNLERRRLCIERKVNTAKDGPLQGFHSIGGQFSLFGCLTAKLDAEPDFRQCTESAGEVNF